MTNKNTAPLTKSLFSKGLQCEKSLWLQTFQRDLAEPYTESQMKIFEQGNQVGALAREAVPGGEMIKAPYFKRAEAVQETKDKIKKGAVILYEAAFESEGLHIRVDILEKIPDSDEWVLTEVKSSTQVKPEYCDDAAFQVYVMRKAGFLVKKVQLLLIDNNYVLENKLDISAFFKTEDITAEAEEKQAAIPSDIQRFNQTLALPQAPEQEVGPQCKSPYRCPFKRHCWKDVPENSIQYLTRLMPPKRSLLKAAGIKTLDQIPDDFDLTDNQRLQVAAEKENRSFINKEEIKKYLAALEGPLFYFDFETIAPAIPPWTGISPFEQTPFQFSLRVMEGEKEIRHIEFLGDGRSDPRPEAAKLLAENLGDHGSIVVFHESFERGVLTRLAGTFPQYADIFNKAVARLWDQELIFSDRRFVHPKFFGRSSIKYILPALVPSMSYQNIAIQEGMAASITYMNLMNGNIKKEAREATRQNLKTYCAQDTLAMVEIMKVLKGDPITHHPPPTREGLRKPSG